MFYFLIFYNHFLQHVNALCEKYDQETELTNFYKEKLDEIAIICIRGFTAHGTWTLLILISYPHKLFNTTDFDQVRSGSSDSQIQMLRLDIS